MKLHCLAYSRAIRVLWMLEELGIEHELVNYERTEDFRAPPELTRLHPLGKSPILEDGDVILAESATILRYIRTHYAPGGLSPEPGTQAFEAHEEWVDYVESSLAVPIMANLLAVADGKPVPGRITDEIGKHLAYISQTLDGQSFLMGDTLTLADIQMSYLLALADISKKLEDQPVLKDYWARLQSQPGFKRATERAGPMTPPFSL